MGAPEPQTEEIICYYEVHPYDVGITIYLCKQCLSTVKCVVLISSVTMYTSYDCNQ
jgi:hypothetical protein